MKFILTALFLLILQSQNGIAQDTSRNSYEALSRFDDGIVFGKNEGSMLSDAPLFSDDSKNAKYIFSDEDTIGSFSQSIGLKKKEGTSQTYENNTYSSIQFITDGTKVRWHRTSWTRYLVQAVHRKSNKSYYFVMYMKLKLIASSNRFVGETAFFRIKSKVPDRFVEKLDSRFKRTMNSLEKHLQPIKTAYILSDSERTEPLFIVQKYTENDSRRPTEEMIAKARARTQAYAKAVKKRKEEEKEKLLKEQILNFVSKDYVRPICNRMSANISPLIAGGGGSVQLEGTSCKVRTWIGGLSFHGYGFQKKECTKLSCIFHIKFDCTSKGTLLLETCYELKAIIVESLGPEGKLNGEAFFGSNGRISKVKYW